VKILYSYNKTGFEADYWEREIAAASSARFTFIPFNHGAYLDPRQYERAQLLDNLYYERRPALMRLYEAFERALALHSVDAAIVDNCFPYHPDYLAKHTVYRVLRTSDGPMTAYDRDFAYVHAYHHVLYHSPAYSADLAMADKLRYVGARNIDFWPMALFDAAYDGRQTEATILQKERDIDVVFVGALHVNKMPLLARVKRAFGRRCALFGLSNLKRNVYFNVKHGFPGWVRPLPFPGYVPLYQRAKIGFNVHNRGDYTVGSYRMFDLPGNGVMQISDGGRYLDAFFESGNEIIGYTGADDLIDKIRYYLQHDDERRRIALNGFRRVLADHRFPLRMRQAGELVEQGMSRLGWGTGRASQP
jgi:spore maturation protein CgeB